MLTKQMGPDVAGFCVDAEDALEAGPEGGHGWPMAVQQVVIVFQPVGEHVIWDNPPASLPDLDRIHTPSLSRALEKASFSQDKGKGSQARRVLIRLWMVLGNSGEAAGVWSYPGHNMNESLTVLTCIFIIYLFLNAFVV